MESTACMVMNILETSESYRIAAIVKDMNMTLSMSKNRRCNARLATALNSSTAAKKLDNSLDLATA
jgi:hypothetical protein